MSDPLPYSFTANKKDTTCRVPDVTFSLTAPEGCYSTLGPLALGPLIDSYASKVKNMTDEKDAEWLFLFPEGVQKYSERAKKGQGGAK